MSVSRHHAPNIAIPIDDWQFHSLSATSLAGPAFFCETRPYLSQNDPEVKRRNEVGSCFKSSFFPVSTNYV
jgi:hypothetical protein